MGVEWIRTALTDGSFIGVTDRLYNRVHTKYVSGKTRHLLRGLFFETLPKTGLYRGELLGLVTLHTMIAAVTKFYKVDTAVGAIYCNKYWHWSNLARLGNTSALGLNTWIFTGQFKPSDAPSTYVWYTHMYKLTKTKYSHGQCQPWNNN